MDKKRADAILDNLSRMEISKGEQNIIVKAINDVNESKIQKKVVEEAYRYALFVSSGTEKTRRGNRCLASLKNSCLAYAEVVNKDNTK